ncbi:hypothetical protein, partial [Xanthomonas codiaei]
AAPVQTMAPTVPATAEPLIASLSTASATPEREAEAERPRPSDALLADYGAPVLPREPLAQAREQSLASSAATHVSVGSADAEDQRTQSTP